MTPTNGPVALKEEVKEVTLDVLPAVDASDARLSGQPSAYVPLPGSNPWPNHSSIGTSTASNFSATQEEQEAERHPKFYFTDDHYTFKVDGQCFRVHGYLFEQASDKSRALLLRKGSDGTIILDRMKPIDFERFLTIVYSNCAEHPALATRKDWASVLKVAHRFNFPAIRSLSISRLELLTSSVQKIVLARKYAVMDWLPDAFLDVCTRSKLPEDTEVARLGYDTFVKIARARELLRDAATQDDEARMAIINDAFGLHDIGSLPRPELMSDTADSDGDNGRSKKRKRDQPTSNGSTKPDDGNESSAKKKCASTVGIYVHDSATARLLGCQCSICLRTQLPTTRVIV